VSAVQRWIQADPGDPPRYKPDVLSGGDRAVTVASAAKQELARLLARRPEVIINGFASLLTHLKGDVRFSSGGWLLDQHQGDLRSNLIAILNRTNTRTFSTQSTQSGLKRRENTRLAAIAATQSQLNLYQHSYIYSV
jgi:hypothetical protein